MRLQEILEDSRGFTLVEVLIVVAIGVILVAGAAPLYTNFQTSAQVNESTTQLIQTLRIGEQRARVRVNNSSHGVYIIQTPAEDAYVLYQGDSYATRDSAYDRTTVLDAALNLTSSLGMDISFLAGTGSPSATGTITITHDVNGTRSIRIQANGSIELE